MPKNFYTFLIIPQNKNSTKKITISNTFLKVVVVCVAAILLCSMYMYYDYLTIKREKAELARLRKMTREHKVQIQGLAERIDNFSQRMDELSQLDKEIRTLVQHDDRRYKGQLLGIGGSISDEARIKSIYDNDQERVLSDIRQTVDQLTDDAHGQKKSFSELITFLKRRKSILAATPSVWPVHGWVTSEFGYRKSPMSGMREFHKGIDIAARIGTVIAAPADGIVKEVSFDREMGRMVRIDHGYGMSTGYGHLLKITVQQGSMVKRGDRIGHVGTSGRTTGSHLHYSVMLNNVPVNPRKYIQ